MVETYAQHNDALQAFHTWRGSAEAQLPGTGGPDLESTCLFVPRSNLEKYFSKSGQLESLLDVVVNSHERHLVDATFVRDHYSQSFATLLCIGEGRMIHRFLQYESLRDQKLPHRTKPDDFPSTKPEKFEEFRSAQWQFCASSLVYGMNNRFKEEDILPIIHKEKIGEGGSAILYKIVVDENYNSLLPRGQVVPDRRRQHKNTFVLKTYRPAEAEKNYKNERDAYMKLRWAGKPSAHISAYYCGFIYGSSYNIILEYADQGTLEAFLRNTKSPATIEDTLLFWDRLFDVTHGIMTIHGTIGNDSSASRVLNGWHQDVKPANILVFGGNGTSPYDCHFKIADLGLTHFKPNTSQPNDPSDLDAFGTRAYGAPETVRFHADTQSSPLLITPAVDIYSMGSKQPFGLIMAGGELMNTSASEVWRSKPEEVAKMNDFFTTMEFSLTLSTTYIRTFGRNPTPKTITRLVLERLVVDMLQEGTRPHAKWLFEKSKRLIEETERKFEVSLARHVGSGKELPLRERFPPNDSFAPSPPSSRSQSPPDGRHDNPASRSSKPRDIGGIESSHPGGQGSQGVPKSQTPPSTVADRQKSSPQQHVQQPLRPTLSIDEGHVWKKKKKDREFAVLPGEENLISLAQRDHIFLVDNSATMKQYSRDIVRVISLLAYMVKKSDKDGLDIFFTQTLTKVNSEKSTKISTSIHREPFRGASDMRGRLQNILQEHINKFGTLVYPPRPLLGRQPPPQPQRPLGFYILTDAKWQPTNVGGLIKDLVQSMIAKGCPKEHVAIQFIRFGDDQASIDKLDKLDHGLGLQAIGMDIVDHTYWNGNVWKQLLGALNDWYDDDPT